jgi:AraC family transcriptional regulator
MRRILAAAGATIATRPLMHANRFLRFADLPPGLVALTATARGLEQGRFDRAAQQAFAELAAAVRRHGALSKVACCISLGPDPPTGPDDPDCRFVAGYLFGHDLRSGAGSVERPRITLAGSLAWWPMAEGRHAVFGHQGPYETLPRTWQAVFDEELPARGLVARAVPFELMIDDRRGTAAQALRTEIWVPV